MLKVKEGGTVANLPWRGLEEENWWQTEDTDNTKTNKRALNWSTSFICQVIKTGIFTQDLSQFSLYFYLSTECEYDHLWPWAQHSVNPHCVVARHASMTSSLWSSGDSQEKQLHSCAHYVMMWCEKWATHQQKERKNVMRAERVVFSVDRTIVS